MVSELRYRSSAAQQLFVQALSSAWRNGVQVYDVSTWLQTDPEAEDKMLRDGDIAYAIEYRQSLVAGRQWDLQPSMEGSPGSELAAMVGKQLLSKLKRFSASRKLLARAFFHGARYARIHGETKRMTLGDGRERWWWFPTQLEDIDKRSMRIVAHNDGANINARWQRWDVPAGQWVDLTELEAVHMVRHVYSDEQGTLGYGRALREALGWWWHTKAHIFHESTQAAEKFAQGILHAKIDGARDATSGLPNSTLINSWISALQDMRGQHVLVSDRNDDVQVIQGNADGWQLLKDMRDEMRSTIVTLVLCANLTTSADGGGSYAMAKVQENSTEALVQFDREALEETLTDHLLGCIWWNNYANLVELGIADDMPRFNIRQEKLIDPTQRAQVAQTLHGMGVDISSDDLYEQTGFRKPQEGEEVIAGKEEAPPMSFDMPPAPGGGADLGDPFGAKDLKAS
jgi:Protein of unknown function (DUF935)